MKFDTKSFPAGMTISVDFKEIPVREQNEIVCEILGIWARGESPAGTGAEVSRNLDDLYQNLRVFFGDAAK